MDYLDFEIEITGNEDQGYTVVARSRDGAGNTRQTTGEVLSLSLNDSAVLKRQNKFEVALARYGVKQRLAVSQEQRAIQDFGAMLFDALFAGEVRERFDTVQREAATNDNGVRLRLNVQPPELAALPWEFVYDKRFADYVCLSVNTPIVRYIETFKYTTPPPTPPPLRMLGMIASPDDLEPLDTAKEKERVEKAVAGLQARGLLQLTWVEGGTWRDLQTAIRSQPWNIFHFIGHGGFDVAEDQGYIALVDDHGDKYTFHADKLARLLADRRSLRLVLLNACEGARGSEQDLFSSTASILVRRGIPGVLAMQYGISDQAAIEFAQTFYQTLVEGRPVDAAAAEARKATSMGNPVEWGTPVLYMCTLDGKLFDLQVAQTTREAERKAETERKAKEDAERLAKQKAEEERAARQRAETERLAKEKTEAQRKAKAEPATPRAPSPISIPQSPVSNLLTLTHPLHLELIRIPAGEFLMGSDPAKDKDAQGNEQPQHRVYVSEFYIGKYPVTNTQYAVFQKIKIPSGKENHPVIIVSWNDAVAFCEWLRKETGELFRLPTEAEWEKAARGTDGRIYPWGNEWDATRLNIYENGPKTTTPVGAYSPQGDSPYGVADMAGNVSEWCADWYDEEEYQRRTGSKVSDPQGPKTGRARVVRGGSFFAEAELAHCAYRLWYDPDSGYVNLGFRVVAVPFDSAL